MLGHIFSENIFLNVARKRPVRVLTWPVKVNLVVLLQAAYGLRLRPVVITTI